MSGQVYLTTLEEQIERDTWEALLAAYENLVKQEKKPPEIDQLYVAFRKQWIDDMHKFLHANADAWEVNRADLDRIDVEKVLAEHGFFIPSLTRIHAALQRAQMSYIGNNKQLMNGAVVEIW